VEGPSDAIYIRAALRAHSEGQRLVEYRDFGFIMYGGWLLKYYDVEEADAPITSLLRVTHSMVLVGDSGNDDSPLRAVQERVNSKAKGVFERDVLVRTPFYEIEFLIRDEVLKNAVENIFPSIRFGTAPLRTDLPFSRSLALAVSTHNSKPVTTEEHAMLAQKIASKKVAIAEKAVQTKNPFRIETNKFIDSIVAYINIR